MMDNLNEKRMSKDRGSSPKETLQEVINDYDDITDVVIVTRHENEEIMTHWSCDNTLKVIGALEVAKVSITQS